MTTQEWQQAEEKMKGLYGYLKLEVDGFNITLSKELCKDAFKYFVYIDGEFCGKWLLDKNTEYSDIRHRFYRLVTKRIISVQKKKQVLSHIKSKKIQAEYIERYDLDKTYSYWDISFSSFKALKSQLIKNNKSIKLIEL